MPEKKTTARATAPKAEAQPTEPTPAPAAEPTEAPKGSRKTAVKTPCLCGCSTEVGARFAPGHDARFASALITAVEFGRLSTETAQAAASAVSDAFGRKVRHALEARAERMSQQRAAVEQAVRAVEALAAGSVEPAPGAGADNNK